MHRSPRLLLAVLALLALALSACGGDDLGSKSAPDILKETFGPGKPVRSGKVDLRVALDAPGLTAAGGPLRLALKGPFASTGARKLPRFAFDVSLDLGGQTLAAGATSTGKQAWLKLAGQSFAVDDAVFARFRTLYERDQKQAATSDSPTFQALGIDPSRWLASPEKAEDTTVGGAETVHVTSKVNVPAVLADLNKLLGRADATGAAAAAGAAGVPSKLTDRQRAQIERSIRRTSLDVYSGREDGTLRRLNLQVAFDVPQDVRASAGGLTAGTLGLDLVLSELNEEQTITGPKSARPLSDLTQAGATGATGATARPGTSGSASAAPAAGEAAYRACLQAAGASIAEAQKCAPLLNGR